MTVDALRRALGHRRWTVVAGVLAGLLVAGTFTLLVPPTYASTASLYVSADDATGSAPSVPGSSLLPQRVTSYAALVRSARVLAPVVERSGVGGTTGALADRTTVTSSPGSAVLGLTVTDADPTRAAVTANAVAGRLVDVVAQLERPQVPVAPPRATLSLVDPGAVDPVPVSPRVGIDLLLGLGLGLLVGVVTAALRGAPDTTVDTPAHLADAVAAPTLGTLPVDPDLSAGAPVPPVGSGYREAVRRIRADLLLADVDDPPRLFTVAGASAGEGSTTTVCALAEAFASGGRVCVVEGDLRRPVIAERLGLVPSVGLTDVLARRASVRGATQRWSGAGAGPAVDVLVAGGTPHNPTELLSSRTMREVLTALRAEYDVVLLDAPPLLAVPDGAVLAGRSDGVVLLCRQAATTRAQLASALERLSVAGGRVLGGVLSMTPPQGVAPRLPVPAQPTATGAADAAAVPAVLRRRGPSRTAPPSADDPG